MNKFYALLLVLAFSINGLAIAKPNKKEIKHMKKIVQTAGRTQLGEFAPEFAHLMMMFYSVKTGTTRTLTLKLVQ